VTGTYFVRVFGSARSTTGDYTLLVDDTDGSTACVVTCPPNQTAVESPEGSGGAVVNYPAPTTTGGCLSVFCSPASGATFPVGTTTVTCQEVIGKVGGFPLEGCTFTVTVTQACTGLTCPANITVANDPNQCSAVVNYPTPSGSGCGTVTCSPASGTAFPVGTMTVTCTAAAGPSCSFTVTVNDTQPPSITCPASLVVSNDPNQCGAVVTYPPPPASDNCPGVTTVCSPPSGSFFPNGVTTVTCTATDAVGNTATCTFTVTVNDTQPPSIACPAPITTTGTVVTNCALSAVVTYPTPTVSDNGCAGTTVTCSPPSGSTFAEGTTTVTCTATDASGNTSSCSFAVTVGGAGLFGACFVDDYTGDTWSIVTDPASPLYRYWRYRVAATGEIICGTANYLSYVPNHSLVAYDNDDPRFYMNANVNYGAGTATVSIVDRSPSRRFVLRDRNIGNDPPCT
jgi:hypothetical protein